MKRIKRLALLMAAVCCLVLLPSFTSIEASAAEPNPITFTVRYIESAGEWRFEPNYPWSDSVYHRELYYLKRDIRDGDKIVVMADSHRLELEVGVRLSNLTIENAPSAVVSAKGGIDECHVLKNSVAAISGDIKNAYVYDNAVANFNNNVENLWIKGSFPLQATVAVVGTVEHAQASDNLRTHFDLYSFGANTFRMENGTVKTAASLYSTLSPIPKDENGKEIPEKLVFDYEYYKAAYPDLAAAFGNDESAYYNHYLTHGIVEGRSGSAEFNAISYRGRYPDLNAAFGDNWSAYLDHYITKGRAEGRDASASSLYLNK